MVVTQPCTFQTAVRGSRAWSELNILAGQIISLFPGYSPFKTLNNHRPLFIFWEWSFIHQIFRCVYVSKYLGLPVKNCEIPKDSEATTGKWYYINYVLCCFISKLYVLHLHENVTELGPMDFRGNAVPQGRPNYWEGMSPSFHKIILLYIYVVCMCVLLLSLYVIFCGFLDWEAQNKFWLLYIWS